MTCESAWETFMGDRSLWSQIQRSDTYLICRAGWRSIGNRYCEPPELVVVGLEDWEEIKADESDEGLDWKGESWVGVRLERYLIDTGFDDSNIINQVIRIRGRGWSWINNESESQDQQHKTQQKVTIEKRKYIYIYTSEEGKEYVRLCISTKRVKLGD